MVDLLLISRCIKNEELRAITDRLLAEADPNFWTAPSSSTGKYHSEFDLGCGGLARHTALVAIMAVDGLRRHFSESRDLVDVMLCAGLLHDVCKNGYPKWGLHTVKQHPRMAADLLEGCLHGVSDNHARALICLAATAIRWHYGQWTFKDARTPASFPLPDQLPSEIDPKDLDGIHNLCCLVLQEADYYSSRTYMGAPVRHRMLEFLAQYDVTDLPSELP